MKMKQLEIEFKTLLTETDYHYFCNFYHLNEPDFHTQTNVYFDTPTQDLRQKHCGLRIRQYADRGEITLKTPQEIGLLETTDPLTLTETQRLIEQKVLPTTGAVAQELARLEIEISQLTILTSLTTKRAEFVIAEGLLALDESWYNQEHDYELELEVADAQIGKQAFEHYLHTHAITYRPAENKIVRATKAK
jgi:uncharacterized protein YjbK